MINQIENKVAEIYEMMREDKAVKIAGQVTMGNGNIIEYKFKIKVKR